MKKILYVASTYSHINNFHTPYIDELKKENHVDVLSNGSESTFNINFKKKIYSLKNVFSIFKIRKILKRNQYDFIVLNTSLAAFLVRCSLFFYRNRPKVINIVHGYLFGEKTNSLKRFFYLKLERIVRKKTDYILTMNKYDFDIAKSKKLSLNEPIMIPGMGVSRINEDQLENPYDTSKFNLLFVGELSNRKNQIELINSVKELKESISNIHLTLLGEGNLKNKFLKIINKENLSSYVSLKGYIERPANYYKYCDLYVSSSLQEGLPFNLIHALEFNKNIICSSIKGHIDIASKTNLVTLYENKKDLCEKVIGYHQNKWESNSNEVFEFYSFDRVFRGNLNVIKTLID